MTELSCATATTADAPAIAALVNSAYRGEASKKGWTTEADLIGGQRTDAAAVGGLIADPAHAILRFSRAGELVACVLLQRRPASVYLGMLSVRPTEQAGGIGRQVLGAAESWAARTWRVPLVELTVIARRRELVAWYLRRGYRDTGRREEFPFGDERVGNPKVEDLQMVVLEKSL